MTPIVERIYSDDLDYPANPIKPNHVQALLFIDIYGASKDEKITMKVLVITIAELVSFNAACWGGGKLFAPVFDWDQIEENINLAVSNAKADTWEEVISNLRKIFYLEDEHTILE